MLSDSVMYQWYQVLGGHFMHQHLDPSIVKCPRDKRFIFPVSYFNVYWFCFA